MAEKVMPLVNRALNRSTAKPEAAE
jgi:hypothetical protein